MRYAVALLVLTACLLAAQTAPATAPAPPPFPAGEISGMYSFLQEGEFVQINLEERGRVTGFISRYGNSPSDQGIFLDHFITKGLLDGRDMTFETRTVHGMWFGFKGVIERGEAKSQDEEGYYLLRGKLTQYSSDASKKTSARSREVVFKSFPQEAVAEPQPKPQGR